MKEYTKGEWKAWRFSKFHNWKVSLGEDDNYIDCGDNEANARLIAATPDLDKAAEDALWAIRGIMRWLGERGYTMGETYSRAELAVKSLNRARAKARGEDKYIDFYGREQALAKAEPNTTKL